MDFEVIYLILQKKCFIYQSNNSKRFCSMRSFLFCLILCALPTLAKAQEPQETWQKLADVSYEVRTVSGQKMEYPIFGREIKKLNGQTITIKGYYLPYEVGGTNKFIFSAYPMSSCYFCGGAGPETVMEVSSKKKMFYSAKPIIIKGRLKLNADDNEHLMYVLEEAERVDE
jgi:hypothetical protein